jgi:hypothetical protein
MPTDTSERLREEANLVERFTQTYRMKFAELIERLNTDSAPSDLQCVRMCVEAVNMMLDSQTHMARTLRALADDAPVARVA